MDKTNCSILVNSLAVGFVPDKVNCSDPLNSLPTNFVNPSLNTEVSVKPSHERGRSGSLPKSFHKALDSPLIALDDHLIAQVQNIVNMNNISFNSDVANRVITSIDNDLVKLNKDLSAFPIAHPFEVLDPNNDRLLRVPDIHLGSIGFEVLDQDKDRLPSVPDSSLGSIGRLPLIQSPLSLVSPFTTPLKRGHKPKHVKTQ